ncbi:MAG: hypothetical protein ACT4QA_10825 [Panacagrimonas sp.]
MILWLRLRACADFRKNSAFLQDFVRINFSRRRSIVEPASTIPRSSCRRADRIKRNDHVYDPKPITLHSQSPGPERHLPADPRCVGGAVHADAVTGLRAHYCFELDAVTDCSGNGNNGIAAGDVTVVPGRVGQGAQFGGFDSLGYVRVPNTPSISLRKTFSIAYWAKFNSFAGIDGNNQYLAYGIQMPLAKSHDRSGLFTELAANPPEGGEEGATVVVGAFQSSSGFTIADHVDLKLGEWVHVVYTFNQKKGKFSLYI